MKWQMIATHNCHSFCCSLKSLVMLVPCNMDLHNTCRCRSSCDQGTTQYTWTHYVILRIQKDYSGITIKTCYIVPVQTYKYERWHHFIYLHTLFFFFSSLVLSVKWSPSVAQTDVTCEHMNIDLEHCHCCTYLHNRVTNETKWQWKMGYRFCNKLLLETAVLCHLLLFMWPYL